MPNMAGGGRTVREAKCSHCYCPAPSVKIYRGTVRDDGAALAAKVPAGLTIVIYRSAVLIYVDEERRCACAALTRSLGQIWIANKAPGAVGDAAPSSPSRSFVLVADGTELIARSAAHGDWIEWLTLS
ncbi:MAG: DUF2332 family protein [Actinomycetota bacterium]|nr:DUF2332 family protein [Actinomycetota bacterium]